MSERTERSVRNESPKPSRAWLLVECLAAAALVLAIASSTAAAQVAPDADQPAPRPETAPAPGPGGKSLLASRDIIEGDWHFPDIGDIRIQRVGPNAFQGIALTDVVYESSECVLTPAGSVVWPDITGANGAYTGSVYWADTGDDYCDEYGADPNGSFTVFEDDMDVCSVNPNEPEDGSSCFYGYRIALPQLRYTALGDSFSSGEANPPFTAGDCHRSTTSWPYMVDARSSVVTLQAHLACSGAVTGSLVSSFKGQLPQIDEMPTNADLVTITIGGNDVGFKDVLINCHPRNCIRSGRLERARRDIQSMSGLLINSYRLIQARLEAGELVVVGYPRLFPASRTWRCPLLTSGEIRRLNGLTRLLDRQVASAASAAGARYVSTLNALKGHELCTGRSWVHQLNGVSGAKQGHPIRKGQRAIANVVVEALYLE